MPLSVGQGNKELISRFFPRAVLAFFMSVLFCCKRSRGNGCWRSDPCQIRLSTLQKSAHGIDEDRIDPFASQATSLAQTEDSFDKTVAFINASSKTSFAPQHSKTQGPFRMIVGRRNTLLFQKEPKVVQFPAQMAHQLTRLVILLVVQANEAKKASMEHCPLAVARATLRHAA